MIYECHIQGRISPEEMLALLDILSIVLEQRDKELSHLLLRWVRMGIEGGDVAEINEIIRTTLVHTDWKKATNREKAIHLIEDLVTELEKKIENSRKGDVT